LRQLRRHANIPIHARTHLKKIKVASFALAAPTQLRM
jgi:hypothetical protein